MEPEPDIRIYQTKAYNEMLQIFSFKNMPGRRKMLRAYKKTFKTKRRFNRQRLEKKYFTTNTVKVKHEVMEVIKLLNTQRLYRWESGNTFLSIYAMLGVANLSFVTYAADYSYYKITGFKIKVSRRFSDTEIATMTGANYGLDPCYINYNPNINDTASGLSASTADTSFRVDPYIFGDQTRYVPFPKNFTWVGSGAVNGWASTANATSVNNPGQFSLYNREKGVTGSGGVDTYIFDVRIVLYCEFTNGVI